MSLPAVILRNHWESGEERVKEEKEGAGVSSKWRLRAIRGAGWDCGSGDALNLFLAGGQSASAPATARMTECHWRSCPQAQQQGKRWGEDPRQGIRHRR